jgi:crotonobetainyl-CoA:carnitine CoA-transferase CaiB-like acyl-CoA transferase
MPTLPRTLEGVRVLDLSRLLPGPYATWLLSAMGAEVVKVEDPAPGDYARAFPPVVGAAGAGAMFHVINRGKRSLVVDLKKPEGRALLLRLVPRFDVVFEQFRPGVMERLGLGWDVLREAQPGLVLCSLSAWGQDGPLRDVAAHDLNCQALTGALWMSGPAGDAAPPNPPVPTADLSASLHAVAAIVAALFRRERTGEGAFLDISMGDSIAALAAPLVAAWTAAADDAAAGTAGEGGPPGRGLGLLQGGIAQYGVYPCADGRFLALGALEPKFFSRFAEGLGHPEWAAVPPFPGPWQEELRASVEAALRAKPRDEWVALLGPLDCCVSPVLDPGEASRHPQLAARGLLGSARRPGGSPSGPGATWAETPLGPAPRGEAPRHGEHSAEILREAGLSDAEIAALRDSGALG